MYKIIIFILLITGFSLFLIKLFYKKFIVVLKGETNMFSDKSRKLKNKIAENEEFENHIDKRKKEVFENESLEQSFSL